METTLPVILEGRDIHGFQTIQDLDIDGITEEAKTRWLRPNEIHAILCNHNRFTVYVRPVNLPKSGTLVLFDRKKLRNFRKDGHNWKKKKDGKTVKEAHEHLKVGNEERIHVYYAHGEDNPTFVRRCYWLLDKKLEHIVLVHYRETQEVQGSPNTSENSNSSSALSDPSPSWILSEESDSGVGHAQYSSHKTNLEPNDNITIQNHEKRLHEINTLEWDDLLVLDDPNEPTAYQDAILADGENSFDQQDQHDTSGYRINGNSLAADGFPTEPLQSFHGKFGGNNSNNIDIPDKENFQMMGAQVALDSERKYSGLVTVNANSFRNFSDVSLQSEDSFGRWMNYIMTNSPGPVNVPASAPPLSTLQESFTSPVMDDHPSSVQDEIFHIIEISPAWALTTESTKILVVGYFCDMRTQITDSNLFCNCGEACVLAQLIQPGVYSCTVPPQAPGSVNLFLSFDGQKPITQEITFEIRAPLVHNWNMPSDDKYNWEEFRVQMRLAHLLFSSKSLGILSNKVSQDGLREAKAFARRTSHISDKWAGLTKSIEENKISFPQARDNLFELTLQNRLQEWILEKVLDGRKISERDEQGQGVIHLCAILGYTWAVYPFSWSGLSLDYRDKFGWTALHWAAYYGREKMVAALLSAGAKPNLVTDPSPENPGGCTAADLASQNGYEGLSAYLAENSLVEHFKQMTLAGNVSGSLQTSATDSVDAGNFSEEELYLKDTLAAYRTAADAAARIQAAIREHAFKLRRKAVESSNPEIEARNIVAAMKIQHAFRNYDARKKLAAAARIQHRFRTWKMRRDFLNMRRQAIKIQAVFRGFQVRRQYRKIVWSVGVLEKAILRWRLKRKGFRGLQVHHSEAPKDLKQENDVEEEFFQASRKQAEERVERSVVRVQAMFRSKRAQEEYRRMKLAHNDAKLEYEGFLDPDIDME